MADEKQQPWEVDVAVEIPKPAGYLRIGEVRYPLFNFLDCSVDDSLRVVQVGDEIEACKEFDAKVGLIIEQLVLLNRGPREDRDGRPALSADVLRTITPMQVIKLSAMASAVTVVPRPADGNGGPSSDSSLASAATTAGPTATS